MSLFKRTISKIKKNVENILNDIRNCLPVLSFPRLGKYIPGIVKGTGYIVTANSGVGKTQFTKHYFMYEPFDWIQANPESKLSLKILYFALEESKEEFMLGVMCRRLYVKHGITVDTLDLQSLFDEAVDSSIITLLEEDEDYFIAFEECVDIIDTIDNPTGIYKYVRRYSQENGTHYYRNFKRVTTKKITHIEYEKLTNKNGWVYSHYVAKDPDAYVGVIVDHMSLLGVEKGTKNLHETMTKMSAEYGRKQITKHYKYFFVAVQQQSADTEKQQFTNMGQSIESKLEPSLAGLGDNKLTARDAHVVFALIAPARFEMEKHLGYDIGILQDNYRGLLIIKNRIGRSNLKIGLFFRGDVNIFAELEPAAKLGKAFYDKILEFRKKLKENEKR